MIKFIVVLFSISFLFFFSAGTVLADTPCCAINYTLVPAASGGWDCKSTVGPGSYTATNFCNSSQKCDNNGNCTALTGVEGVFGRIQPPAGLVGLTSQGGAGGISTVIKNFIIIFYQVAVILFLFMIIFSALQWIISGGDKEKVANARGRLTNAIIGLVILGLAWVITQTLGTITGIKLPFN